jgi:hypothetical protein
MEEIVEDDWADRGKVRNGTSILLPYTVFKQRPKALRFSKCENHNK